MLLSYALIVASFPLILSKKTLGEGIVSSLIGRFLLKITGFTEEDALRSVGDSGHTNVAFLLGILFGVLSYAVHAVILFAVLAGLPFLYLILIRPEIGVMLLFFAMPWLPTMVLAAIVIYTSLCAAVKIFRRKRAFRLEPVDVTVMAFMAATFFGGTISSCPLMSSGPGTPESAAAMGANRFAARTRAKSISSIFFMMGSPFCHASSAGTDVS